MKNQIKRTATMVLATMILLAMFPATALAAVISGGSTTTVTIPAPTNTTVTPAPAPVAPVTPVTPPKITRTGTGLNIIERLEYTFEPDPAFIGIWYTVDFIEEIPVKYDPDRKDRRVDVVNSRNYIGINVVPDGSAISYYGENKAYDLWTKNYIQAGHMAPAYTIQNINGRTFLFIEWKNGDYVRSGCTKIPGYYVMEKVIGNVTDPNAPENFIVHDGELVRYLGVGKNLHVKVPEGIIDIDRTSFANNPDIVEVTLPNSLVSVSEAAFHMCPNITNVNIGTGARNISWYNSAGFPGGWGWGTVPSLLNLNVDPGNKYMYDIDGVLFAYLNNELLLYPPARTDATYQIPNGTKTIRQYAMFKNPYIQTIKFPRSFIMHNDSFGIGALNVNPGKTTVFLDHNGKPLAPELYLPTPKSYK